MGKKIIDVAPAPSNNDSKIVPNNSNQRHSITFKNFYLPYTKGWGSVVEL